MKAWDFAIPFSFVVLGPNKISSKILQKRAYRENSQASYLER
jgi:hypothetical protein